MKSRRDRVAVSFGRVLRFLRTDKGLSQEALAGEADFDRTYPSLLERGLRTPTLTVIFAIAKALGIPATTLVTETEKDLKRR